jgi:intraflagellar transport protein 80
MKLKYKKKEKNIHNEIVTSVCWTSNNQLFSLGDDKIINIWDSNGDFVNKFLELDNYITYMEWSPNSKSGNETLAIGTSEGTLKLLNKAGKIEKSINEAHNTAVMISHKH